MYGMYLCGNGDVSRSRSGSPDRKGKRGEKRGEMTGETRENVERARGR